MGVYLSNAANGTGNWSEISWLYSPNGRAPWTTAPGPPPSNCGDKVVIRPGDDVTYDTKGVFGDNLTHYGASISLSMSASNAIVVSQRAKLRASRTVNTELTARGSIYVSPLSGFLDWGTEASPLTNVTSKIVLNYYQDFNAPPGTLTNQTSAALGMGGIYLGGVGVATTIYPNSATFVGKYKTRNTFLKIDASASSNTLTVDNNTGWEIGDKLYLESPDTFVNKASCVFIQNIASDVVTVHPPLLYALKAGTYIGNFSSNVLIESYDPLFPSYGIFAMVNNGTVFTARNILVKNAGRAMTTTATALVSSTTQYPDRIATLAGNTSNSAGISIDVGSARTSFYIADCSHESLAPLGAGLRGFQIYGQTSNAHYITGCNHFNNYGSGTGTANLPNFNAGAAGHVVDFQSRTIGVLDNVVSYGASANVILNTGVPYSVTIKNCRLHSYTYCLGNVTYSFDLDISNTFFRSQNGSWAQVDGIQTGVVNNCTLSSTLPQTNVVVLNEDALVKSLTIKNCTTNLTLSSVVNNITSPKTLVSLENLSGRTSVTNRKYNYFYLADVENSIKKNGLTSYKIRPLVADTQFNVYEKIPAVAGSPLRIKGNLRIDSNYMGSYPPSASFVGAGITPVVVGCTPDRNTWSSFDVTLNPTATENIDFTLFGQVSALSGGFVYLDGIPFTPFVTTVRHYGFLYDGAINRTVNPLTTLTENQVSVLNVVDNLDYLYDAASYWTIQNIGANSFTDLFTVVGGTLDFGNKNFIINNTGSGFSYNSGTNTVTLNSPILSAGNNFSAIKTTGTITLNTGKISYIDVNANIVQNTPTSLSGVYILNSAKTYTYNTNTATEVEFRDCNIYGLTNVGNAIVTVKKTGTTAITESDAEIVTYAPTLINLTLQGGYVALYDNTSTRQYYQNTDGTIILPAAATGTWTYKVARYGYELVAGSFSINQSTGGTVEINPTYVPDTFITEQDATTVAAYTNLNTTAKIHDYISYIRTTSAGIDYGTLHTQSFGTLSFNHDLTLDATAASVFDYSGGVITLKSSAITDNIIYFVNGDFTQSNGNTISNGIKVRADNLDSEFYFNNVDSLVFFPTENDRNNNTNAGPTITSETIYRFLYGATVSGVTFSGNIYIRVTVAGTTLLNTTALNQGSNTIDFGTTGNIQVIINNQKVINQGVQKASKLIPHSTNI